MITYFIKCSLKGDNLTAETGYKNITELLLEANNQYNICPVEVNFNENHPLSDTELKILMEQKCVMDALLAANSIPYYIIFKQL